MANMRNVGGLVAIRNNPKQLGGWLHEAHPEARWCGAARLQPYISTPSSERGGAGAAQTLPNPVYQM